MTEPSLHQRRRRPTEEELLGVPVDLLTPGDLPPKFRAQVLAEAHPV